MRNLLIGLLAVLLVVLGVVVYKQAKPSESKEPSVAVPLTAHDTEKKPEEATFKQSEKTETVPASPTPAKQEMPKADSDARMKAAEQAATGGDKEKAIRSYGAMLEEYSTKTNPWTAASADIESIRTKHAALVKDLLFNPAGDWKSTKYKVIAGDSLERIRKKAVDANHKPVTVGMIRKANRLEKDMLHPGDMLRIPQEEMKVIVDRNSYTLRVYFGDLLVAFYRVGLGKQDTPTPTGTFIVGEKQKNPTWFPKGEKPIGPSDPNNPLGTRWIALKMNGNATGYGIHGTNKDEVVGSSISQGCVRMYNKDVEELSEILPEGSSVEIR